MVEIAGVPILIKGVMHKKYPCAGLLLPLPKLKKHTAWLHTFITRNNRSGTHSKQGWVQALVVPLILVLISALVRVALF